MISVIITSWKEPHTIGKCIRCIADRKYSGIQKPFEILQVSPDIKTLNEGKRVSNELGLSSREYIQIQDPQKGKPYALGLAIKKAKGNIIVFTDGDTYFEKDSIKYLLQPFEDPNIFGVSGRPISMDSRKSMMGYWGHLLSDSADMRRKEKMEKVKDREYYKSSTSFFPLSGYIMATRNIDFKLPSNILSDDAYISYYIRNLNKEIAYTPLAKCYVKYPTTLNDYYKQKVRSLGGYIQLKRLGIFKRDTQSRSICIEVRYSFFVLKYAKSIKELIWSIYLFPIRAITWLKIYWERVLLKKDMPKSGWERIESTK